MTLKVKPVLDRKLKEASFVGARNESGNVTFMGLLVTLILSYLLIFQIYGLATHLNRIRDRSKIYLCTKKLAMFEESLIDKIETLNLVIKNNELVKIAQYLFPPLATVPTNEIKSTAQLLQSIEYISYLKNIAQLKTQKCSTHPLFATSPYQNHGYQLSRNQLGETILKKNNWKDYLIGEHVTLILESKVEGTWKKNYHGKVLKFETKMGALF